MEIVKILFNKKTGKGIGDVSSNYLTSLFDFMDILCIYEVNEMEKEIQEGKSRWHCNTSLLELLGDGNFQLSRENYIDGDYDFIDFFTVSRPALYDFMEKWKKLDEDAFEKIIITYDGNMFNIETFEKMTSEELNDPMWVERFKPRD